MLGFGAMNRREAGFTLLEICLAVCIALMIVLIAVPSVRGAMKEQQLHATFEAFDKLVHKAQARSIDERRTYALVWEKEGVQLVPMESKDGEAAGPQETLPMGDEVKYAIERPAAMGKEPDPIWTFWRSGVCEPAIIRYKGPSGSWMAKYDALTAHGTMIQEDVP